jgi:hypothetical protein
MFSSKYLTAQKRVLFEKLIVAQVLKKFPACIYLFTRVHYRSLSELDISFICTSVVIFLSIISVLQVVLSVQVLQSHFYLWLSHIPFIQCATYHSSRFDHLSNIW